MVKTVLLDNVIHPKALHLLKQHATVVEMYGSSVDGLRRELAKASAAIVSAQFPIRRHEIGLAQRIEVIGRPGAGVDSVDVASATEAGIPIVFTPTGPTKSVAEHVVCLMLMLAKQIQTAVGALREGDFAVRSRLVGIELEGKTLGIVGIGNIGSRVAEICRLGLGMRILAYDPYVAESQITAVGLSPCTSLLELMSESDFVSVHTPLVPETRGLIGEPEIGAMKPTAYVINTSRGPVVDEAALIRALREGRIAGAGLDVYDPEPPRPDNPLLFMSNVVATPHMSSFTDEGRARMGIGVVSQVLQVLRGERPPHLANPTVWERRRVFTS